MKKVFISIIIAAVIITVFIAYGSKHDQSREALTKNEQADTNPLVANVGQKSFSDDFDNDSSSETHPTPYGKPDINEEPRDKLKNIPLKELAGPVHNEYGIRDDIYEYINKNIPRDNEKALKAAITYAAASQFIYYKASNQKEALKINKREMIALNCLSQELPDNWLKFTTNIHKLMRNTPERDARMWDIDERYFGWQILGTGLTTKEEEEICKSGNY